MGSWLSTNNKMCSNCKNNSFNNTYDKNIVDNMIHEYRTGIAELQKQNDSLKYLNHQLHLEIEQIKKNQTPQMLLKNTKSISMIGIEEYVEKMLVDPNVNINYLPDFVERQLYRNVLKMILGLLDHVLQNSHVNLLNHEIHFDVTPAKKLGQESEENKPDEETPNVEKNI